MWKKVKMKLFAPHRCVVEKPITKYNWSNRESMTRVSMTQSNHYIHNLTPTTHKLSKSHFILFEFQMWLAAYQLTLPETHKYKTLEPPLLLFLSHFKICLSFPFVSTLTI